MITSLRARLLDYPDTQVVLARVTGISAAKLSLYASGRLIIPPHHLDSLARALQCRPSELMGTVELVAR